MASATGGSTGSQLSEVIGTPENLPESDLPTARCVLRQMLKLRLEDSRDYRNIPIMEIAAVVGKMVRDNWIWINSRIENVVTKQEVKRKVSQLWQDFDRVGTEGKRKSSGQGKRNRKGEKDEEIINFKAKLDKLLNIASCHCQITSCKVWVLKYL